MARQGIHVIVVGNEKGGSGKSTTAFHLAIHLLYEGYKVASIDVDNRDMQIVSERIGFTVTYDRHEDLMKARLDL